MSLFDTLFDLSCQDPHRPALCDSQQSLSYGELWPQIRGLAWRLEDAGVHRLALQLDNGLPWALIDLACALANIVVIPVPHFFSAQQQAWLLQSSGADALVGPARDGWQADHPLTLLGAELTLWRCQPAQVPALPEGTAKITYTSGSTGQPKGVCLSWPHLMRVCHSLAERVAPAGVERHLTLLPLATLLENLSGLYVPLLTGACSRIPSPVELGFSGSSKLDPMILAEALTRWPSHSLVLVPELLRLLVGLCANQPDLAREVRFIAVGGGKVAPALILRARALGLPVYEGYGLSECGSVVALNGPDQMKVGSVGRPLAHCRVSIALDGEVMVEGATMLGYLGDPQCSQGPLATGDLGQLDEEGYLHLTGRKKNVQITAFGRNFSPEWIEAQAQLCPAIARIVIFGDGQPANVALIQPLPGSHTQLAQQIEQLNQQLPDYARIHHWLPVALDQHPDLLTANGRPRRERIYHHFSRQISQCLQQGLTGASS